MSIQRQTSETETEQAEQAEQAEIVKLAAGSTSFRPDKIHDPDCPKVGPDAQTMPRGAAARQVMTGRLSRADCLTADEEADDD